MSVRFRDLKFGYASAEQEGVNDPTLLASGYFDASGIADEARTGPRFLFLGYKGSGKSAISERLKLISKSDSSLFVTPISLADMPYTQLGKIVWGDAEAESKYPTAWSWLILLSLYESFSRDHSLVTTDYPAQYAEILQVLRSSGLIPLPTWRQIVLVSSKRSFRVQVPEGLLSDLERQVDEQGIRIDFFVDKLKVVARTLKSPTRHMIVIDGLDDILTSRKAQYDALAALVSEASKLNLSFQQVGAPAKVVVLCRTDLFERLPGANKNKIRQDSAVHLDWYHDPRQPAESNLVKLANLRASLSDPELDDLFEAYFPDEVEYRSPATFLLELTRHTPRDMIQLLRHIQSFAGPGRLTRDQVLSGTRSYSIEYFVPEIKDELVGYATDDEIDLLLGLLGSLRRRDFYLYELQDKASQQDRYAKLKLPDLLGHLFEFSALGNVHSGGTYYTFKYRNRNAALSLEERLILHRGMWKALNLV